MNPSTDQTRREFCAQVCHAASLAVFGGALSTLLQSCSSEDPMSSGSTLPRIQATLSNGQITLTIDASSALATVGNAALVQYSNSALLVARTAQDSFAAVSAICTHQSCTITQYDSQIYTCPCHGSQFSTSGAVRKGPASTALRSYSTQFANDQLVITVT
jgi:Rieske Fe-S protein